MGYVQDNALKGRTFASLAEQNRHLLDWETHGRRHADPRHHPPAGGQGASPEVERPALLPLPAGRFPSFQRRPADRCIATATSRWTRRTTRCRRSTWAGRSGSAGTGTLVRIFNQRMRADRRARRRPSRAGSAPRTAHIHSRKISGVERGTAWLLNKVSLIGPQTAGWAEAMLQHRGIEGVRVLRGC